jgi:hypothetical protein
MDTQQMGGNPFEAIMSQLKGGGGAPTGAEGPMPTAPQAPAQPKIGPDGKPEPDVNMRGQNPGITKFAVQALQALQNMVSESTDAQEIVEIRGIINALTRLMQNDQKKQMTGQTGIKANPLM